MSHFFIICTLLSLSKFVFFSDSRHQMKATFLGHRWQWTDITSLQSWFNIILVLGIRLTLTHWGRVKMAAIFKNENVWISIKVSLKFVPKGPINNIPTPIEIMAWRLPADKPLSETMVINVLTHICDLFDYMSYHRVVISLVEHSLLSIPSNGIFDDNIIYRVWSSIDIWA